MRLNRAIALLALAAVAVLALPRSARADDEPALPDGGSVVTSTDGGAYATADLGARLAWVLTVRCEGSQSTRYKLCASTPCTADTTNQMLDSDRTFDIPVNFSNGASGSPKRYLALTTDDGGVPLCKVQKQPQ